MTSMPAPVLSSPPDTATIHAAIERSVRRLAPAWPLARWIAVNPWWGWVDQPMQQAAERLANGNDTQATMSLAWYRAQQAQGRISTAALEAAQRGQATRPSPPAQSEFATPWLPPSRWLSQHVAEAKFSAQTVLDDICEHCAEVYGQPGATEPALAAGELYARWRSRSRPMPTPLPSFQAQAARRQLQQLPERAEAAIVQHCKLLQFPTDALETVFTSLLLQLPGWASHTRFRHWQAEQAGRHDDSPVQLLAILLHWEALLWQHGLSAGQRNRWRQERAAASQPRGHGNDPLHDPWVWQRAYEDTWRAELHQGLAESPSIAPPPPAVSAPALQAVFCIDVRSEPLRRALEAQDAAIETHGYAGFFGLPIAVQEPGAAQAQPQLPGLLSPSLVVQWQPSEPQRTQPLAARRRQRLGLKAAWQGWRRSATGGFGWVETLGLGYAVQLVRDSWPKAANGNFAPAGLTSAEADELIPAWQALAPEALAERLALIVRGMGLNQRWAPWVLLVGHGSESCNNPYAASLNCGACGGARGDTHARLLARTLNQASVRAQLRRHGVEIPTQTRFIAALHHTVTDDIRIFHDPGAKQDERLPACAQQWLQQASAQCRAERAPRLGLGDLNPTALHTALLRRTADWAETRPEWGLAGNAGFVVAPRTRTRALNLKGRCFLHDYHWQHDDAGTGLAAILTAPVVVAHWINLQYYAATIDPTRWGGGDKTLHNVLANGLGVLEGAGGDLKTGLPWQSVHDGNRLQHEPMRLAVWVEAPPERLAAVVQQHTLLQQLVAGDWIALFVLNPNKPRAWPQRGHWQAGNLTWHDTAPSIA